MGSFGQESRAHIRRKHIASHQTSHSKRADGVLGESVPHPHTTEPLLLPSARSRHGFLGREPSSADGNVRFLNLGLFLRGGWDVSEWDIAPQKKTQSLLFIPISPLLPSKLFEATPRWGEMRPARAQRAAGTGGGKKEGFSYLFCYTVIKEAQTLSISRAAAKQGPLGGAGEWGARCDSGLWRMITHFWLRIETAKVSKRGIGIFPAGFPKAAWEPFPSPCDSGVGDSTVSRTEARTAQPPPPPPQGCSGTRTPHVEIMPYTPEIRTGFVSFLFLQTLTPPHPPVKPPHIDKNSKTRIWGTPYAEKKPHLPSRWGVPCFKTPPSPTSSLFVVSFSI